MITIITLFILLMTTNSYATSTGGVDLTMLDNPAMTSEEFYANYKIPQFDNKEQALIWSHKTKWQEPIRRLLIDHMAELMVTADLNTPKKLVPTKAAIQKSSYYMAQWEDCMAALKIIEDYKMKGIKGDSAMNIPDFKSIEHARKWAHKVRWNIELYNKLENKMVLAKKQLDLNSGTHTRIGVATFDKLVWTYNRYKAAMHVMNIYKDGGGDTENNTQQDTAPDTIPDNAQITIPVFKSINQAVMWAHGIKWDDDIIRKLEILMTNYAAMAWQNTKLGGLELTKEALYALGQYEACQVALSVIEDYKKAGIKGDPDVGSVVRMSSEPVL